MNKSTKIEAKRLRATNFAKVGRAITKWVAMEKSPVLLSKYSRDDQFYRLTKIISHFDGSNNIFVDCIEYILTQKQFVIITLFYVTHLFLFLIFTIWCIKSM